MAWMSNLYNSYLQNKTLSQITLPGTHDTGCYTNDWGAGQAKTQMLDMAGQLAAGIRYFDLRPSFFYRLMGETIYNTWHGPYTGGSFNDILTAITNYLTQQQQAGSNRELIILNISHFWRGRAGFFPWTQQDHYNFINYLNNRLQNWLIPYHQGVGGINLFNTNYSVLTTVNGNPRSGVAIIYDGAMDQNPVEKGLDTGLPIDTGNGPINGFFKLSHKYRLNGGAAANEIKLYDVYANTPVLQEMINDQYGKLAGGNTRQNDQYGTAYGNNAVGGVASTLHLFSWTCTTNPRYPRSLLDNILERAVGVNAQLLDFFTDTNRWGNGGYNPNNHHKVNIIYVDHLDSHRTNMNIGRQQLDNDLNNMSIPVAIAAKLNKYGVDGNGRQLWTDWGGWISRQV